MLLTENDLPLASKETIGMDSHRPMTFENDDIQGNKNNQKERTNYNIKTPILDDFLTKETDDEPEEELLLEDRIRSITVNEEDEFKHARSALQ